VLTFIAGRVSSNIRELEGALTRVVAFSSLTGRPMTVELAQDVLRDVFPQGEAAEVSIKRIQDLVIAVGAGLRITCSKDELVEGLSLVGRAVSSRTAIQILSGILLEPRDTYLWEERSTGPVVPE
jgi:hypothetical protein